MASTEADLDLLQLVDIDVGGLLDTEWDLDVNAGIDYRCHLAESGDYGLPLIADRVKRGEHERNEKHSQNER